MDQTFNYGCKDVLLEISFLPIFSQLLGHVHLNIKYLKIVRSKKLDAKKIILFLGILQRQRN